VSRARDSLRVDRALGDPPDGMELSEKSVMRILLPDGNERSTLASARSLMASGHQVFIGAPTRWALAAASRGATWIPLHRDPLADREGFVSAIAAVAREHAIDLVLPVTDGSVEALVEHQDELPETVLLPLAGKAEWQAATDKNRSLVAARDVGLGVPETVLLRDRNDLERLPGSRFFPAVVKPHRSVATGPGGGAGSVRLSVVPVRDPRSCSVALQALPDSAFPVLLQREILGPGEGLFLLRWDERIIAAFAHRRIREKPPWGGVSVYRESIAPPPDLLAAGTALLDRLGWQGVAMIECKRDLATGRHVFMEINGRLWGSLQLALDAGVDFPRLLIDCARGEQVAPVTSYRLGVRSRWFWGDVDHLYLRLRHGPDRTAAVRDFLRPRPRHDREEIWRWRDPGPFMVETLRRMGIVR
jgi:predicted ATP-grasp superfamily ATP-dependent carboligase